MLDKLLIKEIVAPILIIIGGFILNYTLRGLIKKGLQLKKSKFENKKNKTIIGLIDNIVKYFIIIIVFLMILDVYGVDTKTLIASLGIIGLAIGLSLQDIIKDFLAGITIIFDNQYVVGDYITIGGFRGEVISLGLKTTKIKSYLGEVKIISNRNITEVINHSLSNSRAIVDITFSKNVNFEEIEKMLNEITTELEKEIEAIKGPITILGINKITLNTIEYRIVAETLPAQNFGVERSIKQKVQQKLDELKKE